MSIARASVKTLCYTSIAGIMTTILSAFTIWYQLQLAEKPVVVEGKKPLP